MMVYLIVGAIVLLFGVLWIRGRSRRALWRRIAEKKGNDIFEVSQGVNGRYRYIYSCGKWYIPIHEDRDGKY